MKELWNKSKQILQVIWNRWIVDDFLLLLFYISLQTYKLVNNNNNTNSPPKSVPIVYFLTKTKYLFLWLVFILTSFANVTITETTF